MEILFSLLPSPMHHLSVDFCFGCSASWVGMDSGPPIRAGGSAPPAGVEHAASLSSGLLSADF